MKKSKEFYFSTRDLMMMAALAALGGIASTYINMIGDFFQSLLGFAGTTQWAAGLHIIWLMLAAALIGKPGAASLTGILKGFVELFSGNTHGILVVIVDIVAGLVVDFVLLFSKNKKSAILFYLAAGLSAASNVIVFQVFASLPADVLAFIAILAISAISFVSGVLFGGVMTRALVKALEKAGVIHKKEEMVQLNLRVWAMVAIAAALLVTVAGGYAIYNNQTKVGQISITGDVNQPYEYPDADSTFNSRKVEIESNGVAREYEGVLLRDIVAKADPVVNDGVVMIEATDGYSFFVSMAEIQENDKLLLSSQGSGSETVFSVVGAASSKAWVRGVSRIYILPRDTIEVSGEIAAPFTFAPQDWQDKMDSIYFSIDDAQEKLQGVPLAELVNAAQPLESDYVVLVKGSQEDVSFKSNSLIDDTDVRIFTFPKETGFEFILGKMDGSILVRHITSIEIN